MGTNSLPGDVATFPGPPLPFSQVIPLDRVMSGTTTYFENAGFGFNFSLPRTFGGLDCFACFYFGGPGACDTDPPIPFAGTFALQLRGGGGATLYERNGLVTWAERYSFQWAEPYNVAGGHFTLGVTPYGKNRILFTTRASAAGIFNWVALSNALHLTKPTVNAYVETKDLSGHDHLRCATGMGTIRLDWRRDLRHPITPFKMRYPDTGLLYDNTFALPYPVSVGTAIQIIPDTYQGSAGVIVATLYDAATNLPLTRIADPLAESAGGGSFAATTSQKYYALFSFAAGRAGYETPALYGYRVRVAGKTVLRSSTTLTSKLRNVSITGPDLTPDHETASCGIKDVTGALVPLRQRDRIYARLKVNCPTTVDARGYFIAFEGETAKPVAKRMVRTGKVYPGSSWVDYEPLRLVGMWARLADQFSFQMRDFRQDDPTLHPGVTPDPRSGEFPPWKVTDIIRFLLSNAGIPDDEIDVPDDPLRLWPSPGLTAEDYQLAPSSSYAALLAKFSLAYLGKYLIRDPNVGPVGRGMWRLITPADELTTNVLWEFCLGGPAPGRVATVPGSYGARKSMIIDHSYNTWTQCPEGNYLLVTATGQIPLGGQPAPKLTCALFNKDSYPWKDDGTPAGPVVGNEGDWLGRQVRIVIHDPFLTTQEAVTYVACRVYHLACVHKDWVSFQAPFIPVNDPLDSRLGANTRPLRVGDCIRVGGTALVAGRRAMVRSCNPDYTNDRAAKMFVEAMFLEA